METCNTFYRITLQWLKKELQATSFLPITALRIFFPIIHHIHHVTWLQDIGDIYEVLNNDYVDLNTNVYIVISSGLRLLKTAKLYLYLFLEAQFAGMLHFISE